MSIANAKEIMIEAAQLAESDPAAFAAMPVTMPARIASMSMSAPIQLFKRVFEYWTQQDLMSINYLAGLK